MSELTDMNTENLIDMEKSLIEHTLNSDYITKNFWRSVLFSVRKELTERELERRGIL